MEDADPRAMPAAAVDDLIHGAAALGIALSDTAVCRFQAYVDTLLLWRTRISLTAASTAGAIVRSHILDSLPLGRFIQPGTRIADLGSGAGFPGIPLAIVCAGAQVSLVESRRKRASFLREAVRTCELANAEVIEERAEHLADRGAGPWDVVVSRAVWQLRDFLVLAERLVAPGGLAIAMRGGTRGAADPAYCGPLLESEVVEYRLPGGAHHRLIVYRKP
ncbi:MAG TPA: 16S rRNA (guanine(527)-N(7))-methyltransferase RsmG [Candidatus Margulisiibacteriota bacterium]|nr:16S rRNA (guanine(527)-N(7))-methyltransferase RsmG [Candidatus Margulisiibacteriota bacterium]